MSESGESVRSRGSTRAPSTRAPPTRASTRAPTHAAHHRKSFLPSAVHHAERRAERFDAETRPFEDLEEEPTKPKKRTKGWSRVRKTVFWTSCLLLVVLVMYLSLVYANDRKAQQKRDQRFNLNNYTKYAISVSQELPHGHIVKPEEKRKIPKRIRSEWPRFRYDRDHPYMPESGSDEAHDE